MTPKEKAEELVDKYSNIKNIKLSDYSIIYLPTAKQCALIAVDEILDVITCIYDYDFEKLNPYWEEVKQEIKKL